MLFGDSPRRDTEHDIRCRIVEVWRAWQRRRQSWPTNLNTDSKRSMIALQVSRFGSVRFRIIPNSNSESTLDFEFSGLVPPSWKLLWTSWKHQHHAHRTPYYVVPSVLYSSISRRDDLRKMGQWREVMVATVFFASLLLLTVDSLYSGGILKRSTSIEGLKFSMSNTVDCATLPVSPEYSRK